MAGVEKIDFAGEMMWVYLSDHRVLGVPIRWYPRLEAATDKQRENYRIIREHLRWDDIDEDLSLTGLLEGNKAPDGRY